MTNWREVGAFSLMEAIKAAAEAVLAAIVLTPLYTGLIHAHQVIWIMPIGIVYSAVMWALALPIFLLLRALFAGVPAVVAVDRAGGFTTTGTELGAYLLAFVVQRLLFAVANAAGLARLYAALQSAGHAELVRPVAIAISIVFAAIFFIVFIGLRFVMRGARTAVRP